MNEVNDLISKAIKAEEEFDLDELEKFANKRRMEMEEKILFEGIFNWYGETFTLYTHAKNENEAKENFMRRLAKKLNRGVSTIKIHFNGENDNYFISKKEKKKIYKIPCTLEFCGILEIEAESLKEAIKIAEEKEDLPKEQEYIDGSLHINKEMAKLLNK